MYQHIQSIILATALTTILFGCEHPTVEKKGIEMQEVDDSLDDNLIEVSLDDEMTLPTDRALSYEEALSLRASNISLMNEDYEKLAKLERYAQDPNETNARYVWAEYQTWHSEGSETERAGYKSIYELAKTGHPYDCADVYV